MITTPEEVMNTYEYKVAIRSLKIEYPFVIGLDKIVDPAKYTSLIFMDLVIDPTMVAKQYDVDIENYVKYWVSRHKGYFASYLSVMFRAKDEGSNEVIKQMEPNMKKVLEAIHKSNVIPDTMKLDRQLSIGAFVVSSEHIKYPELIEYDPIAKLLP